jgi:hypothetical protein
MTICFLLKSSIILAQFQEPKKLDLNISFSVIIEMADIISTKTTTTPNQALTRETKALFTPITFYLSPKINFSKTFSFEFRPGLFWGGEPFTGFEYGFYLRYKIIDYRLIFISGINLHSNMGTAHNSGFSTGETITEYAFTAGYEINKSTSFLVSFYKPDSKINFYGKRKDYETWESYDLNYIIKLGLEFTF